MRSISDIVIKLDESPFFIDLLWRPAWYLYLTIICAVIYAKRIKSMQGLLVLTPALGQSLFLLFFNRVQNFRYQYCVVLVGFFLLVLAFYKPKSE